jgi:hypothetical protein
MKCFPRGRDGLFTGDGDAFYTPIESISVTRTWLWNGLYKALKRLVPSIGKNVSGFAEDTLVECLDLKHDSAIKAKVNLSLHSLLQNLVF